MPDGDESSNIFVESLFGYHTRRGVVSLSVDGHERQMAPVEARRVARMLLECAEAADTDSIAWNWLAVIAGDDIKDETRMLMLRQWREMRATLHRRDRLAAQEGGQAAHDELLTQADLILQTMERDGLLRKGFGGEQRQRTREFLMEQLARFRTGEGPEAAGI